MPDLEELGRAPIDPARQFNPGLRVGNGFDRIVGLAGNLGSAGLSLLFVVAAAALMVAVQPQAYRQVAIQLVPSFYRRRANQILLPVTKPSASWMVVGISSSPCFLLCGSPSRCSG